MMQRIDREKILASHNPVLKNIDYSSPLSVGNGNFCFTADVTGFQTLYSDYAEHDFPLCTMSSWGWHTEPISPDCYPSRNEIMLTEYKSVHGKQTYAVKKIPGNEKVYNWFRENPHRLNLCRIVLKDNNSCIKGDRISSISQELHLYEGYVSSSFIYKDINYEVITVCASNSDTLSFSICAKNPETQNYISISNTISIEVEFPYGSPSKEASIWNAPLKHTTKTRIGKLNTLIVERKLDKNLYTVGVSTENISILSLDAEHKIVLTPEKNISHVECSFAFSSETLKTDISPSFDVSKKSASSFWKSYWDTGGFIDFSRCKSTRGFELERRIILSQYLLVIQSCGSVPPQETGLTCSSWYGKFHLEMYPFHTAWLALWNHTDLLEKSLAWFPSHLEEAKQNALHNRFSGARWPKMIGPDAVDSPSPIAPLLVWQQPHILYLLELVYRTGKGKEFLIRYRECVVETAEFMADFVYFDSLTESWNIESPVIPVQEEHDPDEVKNPAFEVEYWRFGLQIAISWLERLGEKVPPQWVCISQNMASMPFHEGLYTAHENCPETFTRYAKDHPSMLMSFGFIPNDRIDPVIMKLTLSKVMECWDYESLWGWDFAMMALTAQRLGDSDLAVDLLLTDTPKNSYVVSGNNKQSERKDLPLYLPGNGSLLLAAAHLAAAGAFSSEEFNVQYENIQLLISL